MSSKESFDVISVDASLIKDAILRGKNVDILLYLAKYNPKITVEDVARTFGKKSLNGLEILVRCNLIKDIDKKITLTNEGIFHLDNLLAVRA